MHTSASTVISAPIHEVFAVFTDLDRAAERLSGVTRVQVLSAGPFQEGTRWRETRRMMGKEATEEMWVTSVDPPRGYEVAAESHGTRYRSRFDFESLPRSAGAGEATRVTMTFHGQPQTLIAKLMMPVGLLFMGTVRRMMARDLEELKTACEAGDSSSAGGVLG